MDAIPLRTRVFTAGDQLRNSPLSDMLKMKPSKFIFNWPVCFWKLNTSAAVGSIGIASGLRTVVAVEYIKWQRTQMPNGKQKQAVHE